MIHSVRRILIFMCALFAGLHAIAGIEEDAVLAGRVSEMPFSEIINLADSARREGDERKAMALYIFVCEHSNNSDSDSGRNALLRSYLGEGEILLNRGNYSEALKVLLRGLEVSQQTSLQPYAASFYKNIGIIYCKLYDYVRGVTYYNKALEICRMYPDKVTEKKVLVNLSIIHVIMGRTDEAMRYHEMARQIDCRGDNEIAFMEEYSRGMILAANKEYDEAAVCFSNLARFAIGNGLPPQHSCTAYLKLYQSYEMAGERDSVYVYLTRCYTTAERHRVLHMFPSVLLDLSKYYETRGDIRLANDFKNRFFQMQDSLQEKGRLDSIKQEQFVYETKKVSEDINNLKREKYERDRVIGYQRVVIFSITAASLIVVFFLFLIFRQKKKIDRSYHDLYIVNSKYLAMLDEMQRRHREDQELLALRERECAGNNIIEDSNRKKYSSSSLDEERFKNIAEAVTSVMDEEKCFCNPDFNLDMLASLVGSNSKYVSQVINDRFGKNFSSFVNDYRVNLACLRLSDTDRFGHLTIRAIGESVGFKSQSTFINVFKKTTGITPSVYYKIAEREKKSRNSL